jgi:formylglycine-generating enzyme required for sulfatase activity
VPSIAASLWPSLLFLVPVSTGEIKALVAVPAPTVIIPAGTFHMGSGAEDLKLAKDLCADELHTGVALLAELSPRCGTRFDSEGPQTEVFLPEYAIDRTEVTVGEYATCVRKGACPAALQIKMTGDLALPVERATWQEATAFCRFRSGRLPTEAEWEKAARGPGRNVWPWGMRWQGRRTNHGRAARVGAGSGPGLEEEAVDAGDGFAGRAPVGAFPGGASPYGALDMAGNVWEWTSGYFSREAPQSTTRFDPVGPPFGSERTLRGGGYQSPPSDLRVSRRVGLAPGERAPSVGFRCVYDPSPARR